MAQKLIDAFLNSPAFFILGKFRFRAIVSLLFMHYICVFQVFV